MYEHFARILNRAAQARRCLLCPDAPRKEHHDCKVIAGEILQAIKSNTILVLLLLLELKSHARYHKRASDYP